MNTLPKFNWQSARCASAESLEDLDRKMYAYYSADATRKHYQSMLGGLEATQPVVTETLIRNIIDAKPASVIELGCGSGWMLERLKSNGLQENQYAGAELSAEVIARNKTKYPHSQWQHLLGYQTEFQDNSFDIAFSYFVIEHCVYPEKHLNELYRLVRPGGSFYVVCPNFVASAIVPSQRLGVSDVSVRDLLRAQSYWSAYLGLYDSRIRLPRALKRMSQTLGPFVINFSPKCLENLEEFLPDVDAVYLANDRDFMTWSTEKECRVSFPAGLTGAFRPILFVQVTKPLN